MKKYMSPEMEYKLFSKEKIVTESTANSLDSWAEGHSTTVTKIDYNNLAPVPSNIKFTF